jgi:excisionase family DNA binding protein
MELHQAGDRENPVTAQIVTYKQAAEVLGICQRTLEHMIDRGELPYIEVGQRGRRVWLDDVLAYLKRQTKRKV